MIEENNKTWKVGDTVKTEDGKGVITEVGKFDCFVELQDGHGAWYYIFEIEIL